MLFRHHIGLHTIHIPYNHPTQESTSGDLPQRLFGGIAAPTTPTRETNNALTIHGYRAQHVDVRFGIDMVRKIDKV